jgi:membrane associated rhomboid family serine protease
VANIAVFIATTVQVMLGNIDEESIWWLILEFDKINPLQWITASFMHDGIMHLLGNMFFLWAFGVVIEGKIGAVAFTILYFVISLIDGAVVQIPMFFLSGESGALGASGVIFGLMMIAVIWAPENEMDCFFWIFVVFGTAEVRIIALGIAFVFMQVVFLFIGGFSMSSAMLHMIGAAIGAPIGFFMLRQDLVDCEGWDVVSRSFLQDMDLFCSPKQRARRQGKEDVIEDPVATALGRQPNRRKQSSAAATAKPAAKTTSRARSTLPKEQSQQKAVAHPEFNRLSFVLRQSIETKSLITAEQTFHRVDQLKLTSGLSDRLLFQFATLLASNKKMVDTLRPLALIANRNGSLADEARLRIAMIQLRVLQKPESAAETLSQIVDAPDQKPETLAKRDQLLAQAKQR